MSEHSKIEWTDATWNPVTGCTKVSAGCANCYAERFAERFRGVPGHPFEQGFDLKLWPQRLEWPLSWKEPRRVFVNSMSDLFHEKVPDDYIEKVFDVMERADRHVFQVLTKRSVRMQKWVEKYCRHKTIARNIWMGVTVERQDYYWRIENLLKVPAKVRFLSLEPMLGPIQLRAHDLRSLQWVILGGESGPSARQMQKMWATAVRDQCELYDVPFFFKQWGVFNSRGEHVGKKEAGKRLEGRVWMNTPVVEKICG